MEHISLTLNLPVKDSYDLIVSGGGIAGCAAALEGARLGLKTLLLEKSCYLGGLATIGLVNYFEPLCNGRGTQVLRGLAEEFLLLSVKYGYDTLPAVWRNGQPEEKTETRYQTEYDPYLYAMALCDLLTDEGVTILFDCIAAQPVMEGGVCRGVMTDSKSGFAFYGCRQLVDATGDSEMAAKAGMPTVDGKNYFSYFPRSITLESCRAAVESGRINRAIRTTPGGAANLYGGGQTEDMPLYYGASAENTSDYLIKNQKLVLSKFADGDRQSRMLVMAPMMPQFRCIRRIEGDYTMTEDDAYRHFPDSVCAINDFDRRDFLFEVPRSALTRRGFANITAAGRCASAEGYAWDAVRVIPAAVMTGQASAHMAARAIRENKPVWDTDLAALQSGLEEKTVAVHFDDALVPPDADSVDKRVKKL